MTDTKPWYMSRTIWAALVSVAASIGAFLGFETDEATRTNLTDALLQIIAALAGIMAIFGRLSARSLID